MSGPHRMRVKIYRSLPHLLVTLLTLILPFCFLALFSFATELEITQLFGELFASTARLVVAYVIAVVLAWILAVTCTRGRMSSISLPLFDVLQSFPTFAALPLAVYLLGDGTVTVIVFLVITIIWPILFSIISATKLIRHDWEEAVHIFGLKGWNYIRYFLFPITVPGIITGSIIGLGEGWEALVATEIILHIKHGLGDFFQTFAQNVPITAFGILGFLIFIYSLNRLIWIPLLEKSHENTEE